MKKSKGVLMPKLRFPEFRDKSEWEERALGTLTVPITERVGASDCVPFTVTSGEGLVSQKEKYGRTIAGKSLKNYYRLKRDDFAFNKSATKTFPQGYIARFQGNERAAVPNSIFTCFRIVDEHVDAAYLDYLFQTNLHGRWLNDYISVGARAHGALNISDDDLYALPIPLPAGDETKTEQHKIADCLGSLDSFIAAEERKLAKLRDYKRGLMQQLFPQPGETQPRLRFPEFRDMEEWRIAPLGELFCTMTGGTPDRSVNEYWGRDIPWVTTSLLDFNIIGETDESISHIGLKKSSAKRFPKNTILVALYGQGKTRGKVAMLGIEAATNQACVAIIPTDGINPNFTFLSLSGRYDEMRSLSNSGGQENLSQGLVRKLPFSYPADVNEQKKIADYLTSLDSLITAQAEKIGTLKRHKRGLMQQLFPTPEETEV